MDYIKLIAFIALAIVAIVIIIVLFNKARKDRVMSELDKLQVAFNDIRTTPLSLKFNTAQAVAKRNDETDKEIKEYYSRYTETQSIIDEVDNILINIEDLKQEHDYGEIKKLLPELQEKIGTCVKEVKETDEFLKKYENKNTEQRSYATKLKQEFQIVRETIRKNINQLTISYDSIISKLDECSSLFTKSEDAMYANDYITAQETLETINKSMRSIKEIVNDVPAIIKDTTVIIPSLVEEAESSSSYIKQKGIYIEHLQVKQIIESITSEVKECTRLVSNLEMEGLVKRVQDAKTAITELNSSLSNEDSKYVAAKQNMENINLALIDSKDIIDFIKFSAESNENLYKNKDEMPKVDEFNKRLEDVQSTYMDLYSRLENLNEPVSSLNVSIEELFNKVNQLKEYLSESKDSLDKNVGVVQRAKTSMIKFQLVVNQAEISVKASHLPSISDTFLEDLSKCKEKIKEIKQMLEQPTVDLDALNAKTNESMDFIYNFSNNVKNLIGLSIMTENTIVFGNKFRSSHPDVDADLSKSEFSFLNGEYTKAVQLAIKTMDTLYPNSNKEIN